MIALNHTEESEYEFHDANLLAAIIVAPPHLIKQSNIKSAGDLFDVCTIPIDVADEYWDCIKDETLENKPQKDTTYKYIPERNTTEKDTSQKSTLNNDSKHIHETKQAGILNYKILDFQANSDGKFKQFYANHKIPIIISLVAIVAILLRISVPLAHNRANNITANSNNINVKPQTTYSTAYIDTANLSSSPEPTRDVVIGKAVIRDENNVSDNVADEINSTINSDTEVVFVTKYGKKYHKQDCFHIQDSSQVFEFSIEDAVKSGYEACKSCFE